MRKERRYSYKDVDMLIACRTLCDNFEDHKTEITDVRANWADPFIGDFRTRINDAINTYLGSDPKKDLRLAIFYGW